MALVELLRRPEQPPLWIDKEPRLRFGVHKHLASKLHYDLRLELDGVLVSFALPNGPSLDPDVSRLAVHVEDQALPRLRFEGDMEEGLFRSGPSIVWDTGLYRPQLHVSHSQEHDVRDGLRSGRLRFTLSGQKLKGSWVLTRRNGLWFLRKGFDRFASTEDVLRHDRSVLTGRRLEDMEIRRPRTPAQQHCLAY